MDVDSVRAVRDAFPASRFVLTHAGEDAGPAAFEDLQSSAFPDDSDTLEPA